MDPCSSVQIVREKKDSRRAFVSNNPRKRNGAAFGLKPKSPKKRFPILASLVMGFWSN
jgi:hypothetical protein